MPTFFENQFSEAKKDDPIGNKVGRY